jgi:phage baseplate assembly protein W
MDAATLLLRLIEIERAVEKHATPSIRSMLMEAQQCALQMHQDRIRILNENVRLRSDALAVFVRAEEPIAVLEQ